MFPPYQGRYKGVSFISCLQEMPNLKVSGLNELDTSHSYMPPGIINRTPWQLYSGESVYAPSFSYECSLSLISVVHLYKVFHPRWAGKGKQEMHSEMDQESWRLFSVPGRSSQPLPPTRYGHIRLVHSALTQGLQAC